MAKTLSLMLPLGTRASSFTLQDSISNKWMTLDECKSSQGTVFMFICNHCPYVKHVQQQLVKLHADYTHFGIKFIAISSNDAKKYPEDSFSKMKEEAELHHYPFPYLYDETQAVARAYSAACTPDFYIFDSALKCFYRGQLDDSRPGNKIPVTGLDIRRALDHLLQGTSMNFQQKPSMGCNIKWKA